MIPFEEALRLVLTYSVNYGEEKVCLDEAACRVLAETIYADRDFPPFHRVTKDGIAINYNVIGGDKEELPIAAIAAAGSEQKELKDEATCIEIMTGAIVPKNADTVVMYEHLKIEDGTATLLKSVKKGQNIHRKGSDKPKGAEVLQKGIKIGAAEIGVLASVGKATVLVKKLPKICLVSTGDELVAVDQTPKLHQIRKSNSYTLKSALLKENILADSIHINDDREATKAGILKALKEYDVLLLSGGVSMGKYDYLPQVFEEIGIEKVFHKVKQRPGKPFWFGKHKATETTVFGFPGNPGSTFASYHVYFKPWLNKSLGLPIFEITVALKESFENTTNLTRFIRAKAAIDAGKLEVDFIHGNGSGDLTSLTESNGFVLLEANKQYKIGEIVPFISTRNIF
ncbi:molybdopterin molybdotransferase MoeA [uncultured Croceitalea sp.]|uniref:molybdopterin molybdotransferase MoeA n=1 Tax=uncultured Croceitalea sp. TaxID=1798908 RepID=UPI003305B282